MGRLKATRGFFRFIGLMYRAGHFERRGRAVEARCALLKAAAIAPEVPVLFGGWAVLPLSLARLSDKLKNWDGEADVIAGILAECSTLDPSKSNTALKNHIEWLRKRLEWLRRREDAEAARGTYKH